MDATREGLAEEMAKDDAIFVVGEGIGQRGGNFNTTTGLYDQYGPERLRDTPICERGFIGLCTGAAMTGSRPVVDFMFVDFVLDGMGELINQISKMQYMSSGRLTMPIVLRGTIGIGHASATHHSGSYYAMFVQLPGLHVVVPTNAYDAKGLFKTAIRSDDPVLFLEHKSLLGSKTEVPDDEYYLPFGQAAVVKEGSDITVVAIAGMVPPVQRAATELEQEGVSVEVVDPRTLAPLDTDTILTSVHKTGRVLIVDECVGPCGIGAEVMARVMEGAFDDLDAPARRLTGKQVPTPYSPPLETVVTPQTDAVAQAVRDLLAA